MKIVADDKIPYILPALHELADEVVVKGGSDIGPADVRDATILLVRTRTRCNRQLLEGSSVQLVVTATIGFDHLDTAYLEEAGIAWANCPGCNATSVAQYIHNSLLVLQQERGLNLSAATLAIIGVGHVGTAVWQTMQHGEIAFLMHEKLLYDPLREHFPCMRNDGTVWCDWERVLTDADIITFHTPLTTTGPYPTYHMADDTFFRSLKRKPVIINAARGGVIDEAALLRAMDEGLVGDVIIDTWEQEPHINPELLRRAFIATPHIAGYSADGKANATRMTLDTVCRFLGRPMTFDIQPPALPATLSLSNDPTTRALQLYDPRADSDRLKAAPEQFEWLRGHYPLRREKA
ncbi:MAG: 4-phosphoerythronate dehydrogenase [Bacteroidaceae bacterium]|nr:4-phosphoerythronate dehydrogenase [Bacteroidaceae bacterium]